MKKINLELGKVSKGMRLRFSLILDSQDPKKKNLDLVNQFYIDGNEYTKINPHPFIVIDISDSFDKNEEWSTNRSVNLNVLGKMKLESRLNTIIKNFQIKNLFFYTKDNRLRLNQEIAKAITGSPFVIGNKTCVFQYVVVPDKENKELEYEGVVFMINSADNFCYLTVEEVSLLYYMLKNTNMMELSMQVLTYYNSIKDTINKDIIEIKPEIIKEEVEPELESVFVPPYEEPSVIPDL